MKHIEDSCYELCNQQRIAPEHKEIRLTEGLRSSQHLPPDIGQSLFERSQGTIVQHLYILRVFGRLQRTRPDHGELSRLKISPAAVALNFPAGGS